MRAVVYTKYGPPDVLEVREVKRPTPQNNELLIRVHATTVTKGDCELRSPKIPNLIWLIVRLFFGLIRPRKRILGAYLAGEIEAVGKDVKLFGKGDQVFADTGARFGGYAEYVCLPEDGTVATKPANMTYEEAAVVPIGGLNALHYLRKANIRSGEKVLINGAGGSFGTFAVQLAKYFGAEVTGVDSTEKLDMVRSIGADQVIDYTKEDFTRNGETYDVIFDVVAESSLSRSVRSLKRHGRYLMTNPGGLSQIALALVISMTSSKKVIFQFAREPAEDLVFLRELIEARKIRSVIDRRYPLERISGACPSRR